MKKLSQTDELYRAILSLENLDEAKRFFRDLLTEEEIKEFSSRWQAAQLLHVGNTYQTIEEKTGLSSRTIARIAKWLKSGKGGYKLALTRIKKQ